jgi:hypothetical protein
VAMAEARPGGALSGDSPIQPELELLRAGVVTYRWRLPHGDILIEVFDDGVVAVNGAAIRAVPATPNVDRQIQPMNHDCDPGAALPGDRR